MRSPAGSSAASSCAWPGGSSGSATSSCSRCVDIARVDAESRSRRDPAQFLPAAYRDLDELDGFLEHLAGEVHDRALPRAARRAAGRRRAASGVAAGAVHARRAPRVPRRAARAHGRGGDARARGVPAAPAPQPRPAADGRDHARPRADARVHLRRRVRADRRGAAARPPRRSASRSCLRAAGALDDERRLALLHCVLATTAPRRRRAGGSARPRRSRCTGSTRSTPASRARSSTASAPVPGRTRDSRLVRQTSCCSNAVGLAGGFTRIGRGAARAWWPIQSSKLAGPGSPRLGRFDSFAASWLEIVGFWFSFGRRTADRIVRC